MEIVHGSRMSFEDSGMKHRSGGLGFKNLVAGEENTPENFLLAIAKQTDFSSPVHHHNFDQFRFALQGNVSIGRDVTLHEGHLSYHVEGAYYGPQYDDAKEERVVLVLQFGGASGGGYMSRDQMKAAQEELLRLGNSFDNGKFVGVDGSRKDGFEGLWEHHNKRRLIYPCARYQKPIVINPDAFGWTSTGREGVVRRLLGVFTERETKVAQLKLSKGGTVQIGGHHAIGLVFVLSGHARAGIETLWPHSVVKLSPGSEMEISAEEGVVILLHFELPMLGFP